MKYKKERFVGGRCVAEPFAGYVPELSNLRYITFRVQLR